MPTLNHAATFVVCRDDATLSAEADGLFHADTRFISGWRLHVNDQAVQDLCHFRHSNRRGRWDMIVPEVQTSENGVPADVSIVVHRTIDVGRLHEDLRIEMFGVEPMLIELRLELGTDFADLFEVRRNEYEERSIETRWEGRTLEATYRRERFVRRLRTRVNRDGFRWDGSALCRTVRLQPQVGWTCCIDHRLLTDDAEPDALPCPLVRDETVAAQRERSWLDEITHVYAADMRLQAAVDQAVVDLGALRLYAPGSDETQSYPAAGIPWFAALFGRDSIIASLQTLVLRRDFAAGALRALAHLQATEYDAYRDAEPGKIPHEMRFGEWAEFGRIPQHPYYGSADSTSLYLLLLAEMFRWSGDVEGLRAYRDVALRCLDWIDGCGDVDGDGFQEYGPRAVTGYPNQCWRDSPDGVPDEHGATPPHPIATSELQAYVYGAKRAVAPLFAAWGDSERAAALLDEAERLRHLFAEHYWIPDSGDLALCLDGNKRAVTTSASDSGHCLWMGIVDELRGARVAERLIAPDLFSGWGIRTLSALHRAYDPHSYHRGSVWPHDSIIAAAGLRHYGQDESAWQVIDGILDAAAYFPQSQLPEVFSGLSRAQAPAPVPYKRANVPQAWAAGSVIHALVILLGLAPDAAAGRLYVDPALPPWCPRLRLTGVRVGSSRLDIRAWKRGDGECDVDVRVHEGPDIEVIRGRRP